MAWGRAIDAEGMPPFWPVREVIDGWRSTVDPATADAVLADEAEDRQPQRRTDAGARPGPPL